MHRREAGSDSRFTSGGLRVFEGSLQGRGREEFEKNVGRKRRVGADVERRTQGGADVSKSESAKTLKNKSSSRTSTAGKACRCRDGTRRTRRRVAASPPFRRREVSRG